MRRSDFRRGDAVTKRTEKLIQSGIILENPADMTTIRNAAKDVIVMTEITGDDVEVNSLIVYQGIKGIFIFSDDRLVVHTTSRKTAMEILTCGKRTQPALFSSEQLAKCRQELQYKLRHMRVLTPISVSPYFLATVCLRYVLCRVRPGIPARPSCFPGRNSSCPARPGPVVKIPKPGRAHYHAKF